MIQKKILGVVGIFVVGVLLGIAISGISPINFAKLLRPDVSVQIENLYEAGNPGLRVSVVKLDQVSGMYKVLFKAVDVSGATTYRETYITQDGKLLSENMIIVGESINQLTRIKNFVDCLDGKSVKIAGISNNTGTLLQFNALGGSYATKLYISCDGDLAQQCVNVGITQVPTIIYNSRGHPGPQSIPFFENLTSCKY